MTATSLSFARGRTSPTNCRAIFRQLAHEQNKCVIVVTHSQTLAAGSDRTLTLRKGKATPMSKP
ncbi:hypothetical protein P3L51_11145 [Streptomyces sp. PSRA5]|uniref:hypothetical protein n=1 Tax=Streptomyces panacea TaxID=3035064 RepID=UPI00339BF253